MITYIYGYPVYICNILEKDVISQDVQNFKGIKETNKWNASCLTSSEHGNGFKEEMPFASPTLKNKVLDHSKIMMNMLDVDINLNLGVSDDYWINVYKKGHSQELHWHRDINNQAHILFSFVYFVKFDCQKDAKLIFINPAAPIECKELEVLPSFSNEIPADVTEGQLIIFPNIMLHRVEEQKTDGPRITIAGNLYEILKEEVKN
jgi:hypothetical protein